jgi:SAM-dependent methyltransferase
MLIAWDDRSAKPGIRCPVCGHHGEMGQEFTYRAESLREVAGTDKVAMLRCPACDVRFTDPLASVDYEDADERGAKFYLESGAGIDVMLEALALSDARPVSHYLEIGCAFGFIMDYARRILGWKVRGFDPGGLARLGRDTLRLPIENGFFQSGSGFDNWADLVFCSEVIEHIPNPKPFLDLLASALRPDGQLILTTPNGDALAADEDPAVLSAILSPGHHIVLYNPASLTALLKRHGFSEVRVQENGFQLRVAASRGPISGRSAWFDRGRYRAYLQALLAETGAVSPLGAGIAYRLFKEQVNAGDHGPARETYALLRTAYRQRYGLDLDDPAAIPVPPETIGFEELGERWPFNLAGLLYFNGILDWLGDAAPAKAASGFLAAARIGRATRQILRTAGVDDLEMADIGRQAGLARLSALAQCDPPAAAQALRSFVDTLPDDDAPAARRALAAEARRRLFTDLVNLGHAGPAEVVLAEGALDSADAQTAFALGWHLMSHRRDFAGAAAALRQAWVVETAPADLRRRALERWLLVLAESDPAASDDGLFRDEVNRGHYAEALGAFGRVRDCYRRIYALDLDDPAMIPLPSEATRVEELLARWPLSLCAALYYRGLIDWLGSAQPARAAACFRAASRFAAAARGILRAAGVDHDELADLGRQAAMARLSALAQYDPPGAAEALLTFVETLPEEEGSAALAAEARRRVFTDLVNFGHLDPARIVLDAGGLGLASPPLPAELPAAYALAIYLMNRKSDFAAAAALFAEIADVARRSAGDLFWMARFHHGLAIKLGGLGETDDIVAEMRTPGAGLPPVPETLLGRVAELATAGHRSGRS